MDKIIDFCKNTSPLSIKHSINLKHYKQMTIK